jgi:hypothetical protein
VNIGSDLLDIEISTALNNPEAVRDTWENLMSEEKNKEEGEMITTSNRPTGTRRMRPQGQTEGKKMAWDQETKDIRNAKARERRAVKKVEAQRQLAQDQEEIERLPQQEA